MNIGTVMKLYTKAQHTEQIHNNNGQDFTQHKEAAAKRLSELLKMLGCSPLAEYCVTDLRRW